LLTIFLLCFHYLYHGLSLLISRDHRHTKRYRSTIPLVIFQYPFSFLADESRISCHIIPLRAPPRIMLLVPCTGENKHISIHILYCGADQASGLSAHHVHVNVDELVT
ncbi:hypothetical protein DEU56DRAFT_838648, partial [Suillus clintonianus]|uniref:uncharacterized protein n=1 Tax=Suillus clintonianus TaxID=1904413 RepID=UPI001B877D0C